MSHIYRVHEFAKRIGKSTSTLRRWDERGVLKAKRHPSGHRYYDESDVHLVLGGKGGNRKTVVYCRVSSVNQKNDLRSQVSVMEQFCTSSGITVDEWIQEIGKGMDFKRQQFIELMFRVQRGEIGKLLIAHRDRLVRFGFEYFEAMAEENGCELVVVNQESLSPQQEMVEDLMAVVDTFAKRFHGLKKCKKTLKGVINKQNQNK